MREANATIARFPCDVSRGGAHKLMQALDHQEVEWQFDADDLGLVEDWLKEHSSASGFAILPEATKELTDAYYDTVDWRFYRAGYALRVRRDGKGVEATMKSLSPAEDGLRRRREISEPLRSGGPKTLMKARGPVGERLRALVGSRDLRPLFEVRTHRRTFAIRPDGSVDADGSSSQIVEDATGNIRRREETLSADEILVDATGGIHRRGSGAALGEVALDSSEISGGAEATRLQRVEVEVEETSELHDEVGRFVDELRGSQGLRPAGVSKFEAGLSASGLRPEGAPELGSTEIDATLSAGEVAFAVLRRHFAAMLDNEPGVRLGEDPEDLHDMRVATRRLRATLKLYADFLPKRAWRFERDLRWVGGSLGEVRDLDVHLERLAREASEGWCGEALEEIIAALQDALQERRGEARRRMLGMLDSGRYERLLSGFAGMLRRGRIPAPTGPILEVAPRLVRRRYEKARKAAAGLSEDSPPEAFHDLRKKGRRLRYALEPLQGIYGEPSEKMVEMLEQLQDDLGEHQDLVVAVAMLREHGVAGKLPPQTIFSMGSMAGRYAREAAEIRAVVTYSKPFRAFSKGKEWKKFRKTMRKRTGEKVEE
jgi:triphosphatase